MRLFISIPLSKDIRKELAEIRKEFSKFPAKWVEEENLHITLVFIGKVEKDRVKAITDVLDSITSRPINLKTDGFSLLPNKREARILVVKLTGETEKLSTLTEKIKEGLRKRKILRQAQDKPFQPHITLGRLKRLNSSEKKKLKEKTRSYDLPELRFKAKRVELIESKLTPVGPVYKTIKASTLG